MIVFCKLNIIENCLKKKKKKRREEKINPKERTKTRTIHSTKPEVKWCGTIELRGQTNVYQKLILRNNLKKIGDYEFFLRGVSIRYNFSLYRDILE